MRWIFGAHFFVSAARRMLTSKDEKRCPKGEILDESLGRCRKECQKEEQYDYKLDKCRPICPEGTHYDPELVDCRRLCKKMKILQEKEELINAGPNVRIKVTYGEPYSWNRKKKLKPGDTIFVNELIETQGEHVRIFYDDDEQNTSKMISLSQYSSIAIKLNPDFSPKASWKDAIWYLCGTLYGLIDKDTHYIPDRTVFAGTYMAYEVKETQFYISVDDFEEKCGVIRGKVEATPIKGGYSTIIKSGEELRTLRSGRSDLIKIPAESLTHHNEIFQELGKCLRNYDKGKTLNGNFWTTIPNSTRNSEKMKKANQVNSNSWEPIGGEKRKNPSSKRRTHDEIWERETNQDSTSYRY